MPQIPLSSRDHSCLHQRERPTHQATHTNHAHGEPCVQGPRPQSTARRIGDHPQQNKGACTSLSLSSQSPLVLASGGFGGWERKGAVPGQAPGREGFDSGQPRDTQSGASKLEQPQGEQNDRLTCTGTYFIFDQKPLAHLLLAGTLRPNKTPEVERISLAELSPNTLCTQQWEAPW